MMTTKLHASHCTLRITSVAEDAIYAALYDMDCKRHTAEQHAAAKLYWREVGYWQPDDETEPLTLRLVEIHPDAAGNTQYEYKWV